MKPAENVYLIGFMAAGKTRVGRLLAGRLRRVFLDSDREITRLHGSPAAIFKRRGEAYFRRLEARVIARLARRRGIVAALGGGAVVDPVSARRLRASGRLVYLRAGFETIWRRGRAESARRPLWTSRAAVRGLLMRRARVYSRVAHEVVSAAGTPEQVAARILRRFA